MFLIGFDQPIGACANLNADGPLEELLFDFGIVSQFNFGKVKMVCVLKTVYFNSMLFLQMLGSGARQYNDFFRTNAMFTYDPHFNHLSNT